MLNRVINGVKISISIFIIIILCITNAYADNSQFHKKEYQNYPIRQESLFQSQDLFHILRHIGLSPKVKPTHLIETENYIHEDNEYFHWAVISHKTQSHKFVIIGNINHTFFLSRNSGIWYMYQVVFQDQNSYITKLYHDMLIEFYLSESNK